MVVGAIVSDPAVLTVTEDRDPPYLVYEPESQTVYEGQSVTFLVYAIGKEPLSYQWQKDNVDILEATTETLTLESVDLLDDGSEYRVIITNDNGETTSSPAVLTVLEVTEVPTIVEQPESVTVLQGEYASFAVYATGQGDLSYQWQKNGVDIADATESYLDIQSADLADNGANITCVVSNRAGSVTSAAAVLTVNAVTEAPTIVDAPVDVIVEVGQSAYFYVYAEGQGLLTYQWQRNGVDIEGATESQYILADAKLADSSATFTVTITNAAGSVTSDPATLTVNAITTPPTITTPPYNVSIYVGEDATFNVSAAGAGRLDYQWHKNGQAIEDATSSSYTVAAATLTQSGDVYKVTVSNAAGSVTSSPATLSVLPEPPVILQDPEDLLIAVGEGATFEVYAQGDGVLRYQWYKNGVAVGPNSLYNKYAVSNADKGDHGDVYSVVVSNKGGSTESYGATLDVNEAPFIDWVLLNDQAVTEITIPVTGAVAVSSQVTDDDVPDWGLGIWYEWFQTAGDGWMFANDPWAAATNLYFSEGGDYEIELYVDDWHLAADSVTANVTVVEFGEIEFDSYSLPVGGSVTASLSFTRPAGRTVQWSISGDALGCSIGESSGIITPGTQTGTITVVAKDSELGEAYSVTAEIDVISLESFTVLDGSRGIIADQTNSVTASSDTIETLLVKKGSNAAVIKMEVGVSPSSVIPVNVLWKITGGSASPTSGNFGGLRPYALLNTAGSYDVKAGCDTNKNNTLDESEVTRTIRVMAVQFTNTAPGNICQNDNDNAGGAEENKGNGTPDKDESGFSYDDQDIIAFSFDLVNAPDYGTLTLSVTTDVLEVWTDAAKSSQPTALSWDLSGETPPSTLYLEGTAISTDANVTLTYTWAGQSVSQVRKMVVLGEGFDSQMVAGCDLYLIPFVDGEPTFGPVCKDQRVTFKVVDCRTEEEPTEPPDPPAPCTCPAGLGPSYRIVGYHDGLLLGCQDCPDNTSSNVWDGVFEQVQSCHWMANAGRIDGKGLDEVNTYIKLDTATCKWNMMIQCYGVELWVGEKTTGNSPVGTYTRTGGCDGTGSLQVEGTPPCSQEADCETNCNDLTLTLSGASGPGCYTTCDALNGEYPLVPYTGSCGWSGRHTTNTTATVSVSCWNGVWVAYLRDGMADFCLEFHAPNQTGCPPASGWYLAGGDCAEGGGTMSITGGAGDPPPSCPADCSSHPGTISATISGLSGTFGWGPFCNAADLNGVQTLTKQGTDCYWLGGDLDCDALELELVCNNGTWQFNIGGGPYPHCSGWTAPDNNGNPPETGWTKVSGECSGGTLTLDVDGDGVYGEGSDSDPVHENDAVVTELIVNGGSDVSGDSTSSERTATASTPGENQLSAQATVEWDGETHTKTVQLTVIEITGIEYSENGGDWVRLEKEAPADGDIVALAGDELTLDIQTKYQPDNLTSGELSAVIGWELNNHAAGYISNSSGPSATFVYDHVTPYLSEEIQDVKVSPTGCTSDRGPACTFFNVYSSSVAMLLGATARDKLDVSSDLSDKVTALKKTIRNAVFVQVLKATYLEGTDSPIALSIQVVPRPFKIVIPVKSENGEPMFCYVGSKRTGDFYYLPAGLPPESDSFVLIDAKQKIYLTYLSKKEDREYWFAAKPYGHVTVMKIGLDIDGKDIGKEGEDDLDRYLPGYDKTGKVPVLTSRTRDGEPIKREEMTWHWHNKEENFTPQNVTLYLAPLPWDAEVVEFVLANQSKHPGICENAGASLVSKSRDPRQYDFYLEGYQCSSADLRYRVIGGKLLLARKWPLARTVLTCLDYGASCKARVHVWSGESGALKEVTAKSFDYEGNQVWDQTLVPRDDDSDGLADHWECEQVVRWYQQYREPDSDLLDDYVAYLAANEELKTPSSTGTPTRTQALAFFGTTTDKEKADPDGDEDFGGGPIAAHAGEGDAIDAWKEYRGYVLDVGGNAQNADSGHAFGHRRLSPSMKEMIWEVDGFKKGVQSGISAASYDSAKVPDYLAGIGESFADPKHGAGVFVYFVIDDLDLAPLPTDNALQKTHVDVGKFFFPTDLNLWRYAEAKRHPTLAARKEFRHFILGKEQWTWNSHKTTPAFGETKTDLRVVYVFVDALDRRKERRNMTLEQSIVGTGVHEIHHGQMPPTPSFRAVTKDRHFSDPDGDGHVTFSDQKYVLYDYALSTLMPDEGNKEWLAADLLHNSPTGSLRVKKFVQREKLKGIPEDKILPNGPMILEIQGHYNLTEFYASLGKHVAGTELIAVSFEPTGATTETLRFKVIKRALHIPGDSLLHIPGDWKAVPGSIFTLKIPYSDGGHRKPIFGKRTVSHVNLQTK